MLTPQEFTDQAFFSPNLPKDKGRWRHLWMKITLRQFNTVENMHLDNTGSTECPIPNQLQ